MTTQEEEIQKFMEARQQEVDAANLTANSSKLSSAQQQMDLQMEQREKGMIKEQLDLTEELKTMKHLLHGHVLEEVDGTMKWIKSTIPDMEVLSDYGVYLIMNAIVSHTTKTTLLSNFDNETIMDMMHDFSDDLNDTLYMESEACFKYPSLKDCQDKIDERIKRKVELREFALKLLGKDSDSVNIKNEILKEMEDRIESELGKVKELLMKNKYKRYLILMRMVRHFVHASLNRAFAGQERKTLRQHTHVTETYNPNQVSQKKPSRLNPLNWGS